MVDEALCRLERAWGASPGDLETLERLIQDRLRFGIPVTGDMQESRVLPTRIFESDLPLQVQALKPGGSRPLGLGKTPTKAGHGIQIPEHCAWWAMPIPPGRVQFERLREQVVANSIRGLSFEKKKISDEKLALFSGLELSTLILRRCPRITDAGLAHVATMKSLGWLNLEWTGVTDAGLERLTELPHLFSLKLWQDTWDEVRLTAAAAEPLSRCSNLRRLDLMGCPLGGAGLARLGRLSGLVELGLHHCDLSAADLAALAPFSRIQHLDLLGNTIEDAGLEHVGRLSTLLEFKTPRRTSAAGLRHLANLPNLKRLVLGDFVTLTDEILQVLATFPALEVLDIRSNSFDLQQGIPGMSTEPFDLYYPLPPGRKAMIRALEDYLPHCKKVLPRPNRPRH